jgi:hypothetical protein
MSLMINFFYKFNEIGWLKMQLNFFRLFYHNYLFCWDMIKCGYLVKKWWLENNCGTKSFFCGGD